MVGKKQDPEQEAGTYGQNNVDVTQDNNQGSKIAQQPPQPIPQMQVPYRIQPLPAPVNITSDNKIGARFMMRSKIGDGLSVAALITGIIAIIYSSASSINYYYNPIMMPILPLSIAAMTFGVIGTRLQRLVTKWFGIGVAGAALGLVSFLILIFMIMMYSSNPYGGGW